jgi:hypothetical protein
VSAAPAFPSIDALQAWRPDTHCVAKGDEYAGLALRCYAAAGLGDAAIAQRMRLLAGNDEVAVVRHQDAALALARHGVAVGASARQIVTWFAWLAHQVPLWPDDPEEIAALVRLALLEDCR